MKIRLLIILTILSLFCCKTESKKTESYSFITSEINEYFRILAYKTHNYMKLGDTINVNKMNELTNLIFQLNEETSFFISSTKENPRRNATILFNDFFMNQYKDCYSEIGEIEKIDIKDTLYLHNLKFNYIKCVLKNSQYYDSLPELHKNWDNVPAPHHL